ncbi:MAG: fibronectin type III domain-containing protein [Propionicimonas sp.]
MDPADGTLLVGYIDPGAGRQTYIQRIDPNDCTTESTDNPTGSSRDRCAVLDTIGLGTLVMGGGTDTNSVTFSIQVEPVTGDIYVAQGASPIQVFESDGTPKGAFPAFGIGTSNGQVQTVRGIAFDARGFMYLTVSEGTANTRVQIFARTPESVTGLTGVYTDATNTAATLTWDALPGGVTPDAQAPLRDYVIEQSTDGGLTWSVVNTPQSTAATVTLTGLDPLLTYQFRVSAWNEAGNGDPEVTSLTRAASASTMSIVKAGNGVVTPTADDAVEVDAGSTVEFEYTVTNTGPAGSAPVTDIELSDSMLGDITDVVSPAGFAGSLAAGESVVFRASGPVGAGAYRNTATVSGSSAGQLLSESDDWFGFGVVAGLEIVKTGNGEVATTAAEAVEVVAGSTVEFSYTVTNTGNVPVSGVALSDDVLGSVAAPSGFDGTLAAGDSVTFTASGPVALGDYVNVATATGTSGGAQLRASTEWHGVGVPAAAAGISVVKTGNGVANSDAASALQVAAGSTVEFSYTVTNTGNVPVTDVALSDDVLGSVAAPSGFDGTLAAGDSVTFTASGTVGAGAYRNTATVSGSSLLGSC